MKMSIRRFSIAAAVAVAATGAARTAGTALIADSTDPRVAVVPAGLADRAAAADEELHIVLNVAGNRLFVYENGERTHSYTVSVGLPGYETPAGEYRIREVIWNPWWHPPNSAWARGRTVEAPGPDNPMGRVKLHFSELYYIHGTPESQALGDPASRGCVRMRNSDVIELTRLVHKYASPRVTDDLLVQLEETPSMTRTIRLQQPVRFSAHYEVATVENGFLIIYPDIYGLMKKELRDQVELKLEEHGVDLRRVNREHLNRLVEKGGTRRVAISLDTLTTRSPAMQQDQ